ncbi:MAG: hypothetical protein A2275_12075 [Bacteroidetes bacterium RIFOXYA12_FULL_35_11]|nr:MAG: hypothetical protein A2X01_17365 [Bacteroidetes bacterium GWF2_35_48]OFY77653.1 MAG: hypothetical protein A2275_12075 [Bacteroidetes bacterium RIFOXYA12_FULL_35_11]OFY95470.1 MAG: hypothetical protein A2491_11395 [Bacteroidetes bacterium RIFOXYC12_FULL_35_7]HBX52992.1 hypothetical protein [Bacteroidales bacterium]
MNIKILTPIPFWHVCTQELIDGLKKNSISVTCLDIWELRYIDCNNHIHNLIPKICIGFTAKIYRRLFRKMIIKKYIHENDIVDIQWCGHYYSKYIESIKKRKVKIIATLFGSDFYRSSIAEKKIQKKIFEVADKIVMGENMQKEFDSFFPGLDNKIEHNQYGSNRIDLIAKLNTLENRSVYRNKFNISKNKIVVTIGYNAKKEQQHLLFLNLLKDLNDEIKQKLFLIIPMALGRTDDYVQKLKLHIKSLSIDYLCIENKLTNEELAETKILSDITVNCQTTDALASSIKEAMTASNVLLVGDWLPYQVYEKLGVFFERSNKNDFLIRFFNILENLDLYKKKCQHNKEIITRFASWKSVLPKFIDTYKQMNHGRD